MQSQPLNVIIRLPVSDNLYKVNRKVIVQIDNYDNQSLFTDNNSRMLTDKLNRKAGVLWHNITYDAPNLDLTILENAVIDIKRYDICKIDVHIEAYTQSQKYILE